MIQLTPTKKILFILSLPHSGSTVLSVLLGRHRDAMALGEIQKSFRARTGWNQKEDTAVICSCGAALHDCPLWGEHLRHAENLQEDFLKQYALLTRSRKLEQYNAIIDSSKKLSRLEMLRELEQEGDIEIHAVFLLKDVRAWIASAREISARKGLPRRSLFGYGSLWYRENVRMKRFLDATGIPYSQVGYEGLCRDPAGTASRIFAEAGLSCDAFDIAQPPNMHIAHGNRVRSKPSRLTAITYDDRGMHDSWINLVIALQPSVFLWNRANVRREKIGQEVSRHAVAGSKGRE